MYKVLRVSNSSTIEDQLNEAVEAGYEFVSLTHAGVVTIVVLKQTGGESGIRIKDVAPPA
jgi:hypothetical protein